MTRKTSNDLTRRFVLQGSAGAALALFGGFSPLALAGPKATATSSKKGPLGKTGGGSTGGPKAKAHPVKPGAPLIGPTTDSLSPEEKALGDAIAHAAIHGIVVAAASPTRGRFFKGGFASIAQTYAKQLPKQGRGAASLKAKRLLASPAPVRRNKFGVFATRTASAHSGALHPVPKKVAAAAREGLVMKWKAVKHSPPSGLTKIPKPYKKVGFFLNEVTCKEETNEVGADQIKIGGVVVSPTGEISKIKPFMVSSDFDQGETKTYYPVGHKNFNPNDPYKGRHLASFHLASAATQGAYPAGYAFGLIMVEEDSGGFSEMLQGLWEAVGEEVKASLEVVSAVLGGAFGQIIGNLMGYILQKLLGFIAQIFDNPDDYVDRVEGFLSLASPNESYFASLSGRETHTPGHVWAAKRQTWKFKGDGGYYKALGHWRVWS